MCVLVRGCACCALAVGGATADTDFQERIVEFPLETGTVLTTSSSFSTLEAVGALSQGSLVTGFGTAEVSSLLSTGFSHLSRDSQIGTTSRWGRTRAETQQQQQQQQAASC